MTQEALAVDADIDRTWVSGIERCASNASVDLLERIAAAMDVDISELFAKVDPRSAPPKGLSAGRKPSK